MPIIKSDDEKIRPMHCAHAYHHFLSKTAQRVNLVLAEKGAGFRPYPANPFSRDNYLKIHPNRLMPAMVYDGGVITESIHILRYIEEIFADVPLYPEDQDPR